MAFSDVDQLSIDADELGTIDPLEREIFRYTAASITEELESNITRTAYSPLVQEAMDYCVALMDTKFRPFMHSVASLPIFCTDMGEPVRDAVAVIGVENIEPGDIFVYNYGTGQHINNVTMATPLFHGDELSGFLAIRAHWADLGGLTPGGQSMKSRSVLHEGTRYRGLRLVRKGQIVPEVLATIQANTWQVESLTGDIFAHIGACTLGVRRWQERVTSKWSAAQIAAIIDAQLRGSEAYARNFIRSLPDGEYKSARHWSFELEGERVILDFEMVIRVEGDRMICDFSGMPPQSNLPINAGTIGGAMASARLGFRYLIGGDILTDAGLFAPIDFVIPEGTIVSASPGAGVGYWAFTISLLIDMFIVAIGNKVPDIAPASHNGAINVWIFQGKRDDGSTFSFAESAPGGAGAEKDRDGDGPFQSLYVSSMRNLPVEMVEARMPLRFQRVWLDRESGGAGQHRGGPAAGRVIEALKDMTLEIFPQPRSAGPGINGGGEGTPGGLRVKLPNFDWVDPEPYQQITAGTLVEQLGTGGGGWGRRTE